MRWLKSVTAFANAQGGRILFGVANDGSLIGLADVQNRLHKFHHRKEEPAAVSARIR